MDHYDFEARIPLDHLMHLVAQVRNGTLITNRGDNLMCLGSISGELGALLKTYQNDDATPIGSAVTRAYEMTVDPVMDIYQVSKELEEELATPMAVDQPMGAAALNPYVLALILRLIKLAIDALA